MEPRIESEALLEPQCIEPGGGGYKNQVPAVARHRTRDQHERVFRQQCVAEGLLAGAGDAGPQPVRIWHILGLDNLDVGRVENRRRREHMGNSVQRRKSRVNRYRRPYQTPLILIPAAIDTVTNARGVRSFNISWTGEDLQPNLSLKRKLAIDFGIDLPEFGEDDSPDTYFDRVRHAVAGQASWRIRRFVTLTLFTNLGKLLLYLDLDPAKWPRAGSQQTM